ncbi:MAG: hypothetical protein ACYTGV_01545 [Planctomycetota bacterium]|jgi:hypothetical protein
MDTPFLGGLWGRGPRERPGPDPAAQQAKSAVHQLEARLDRALLTTEALWTIVRDRVGVTEAELAERIVDLDLTDGRLDGRIRRPALECPACSRRTPRRLSRCMYCGVEVLHDPFS